jgi:hypothetical protein
MKISKILFFIFAIAACAHTKQTAERHLRLEHLDIQLTGELNPSANENFEPNNLQSFSAPDRKEQLKVLTFSKQNAIEAKMQIHSRLEQIDRLFQREVEPYFGTVTDHSECKQVNRMDERFSGYANGNFVLKACPAPGFYFVSILWKYCEARKTLYELRFFSEKRNDVWNTFSAKCT